MEILIPLLILGLAFLIKLFTNRKAGKVEYIEAICELPLNIIFLAITFSGVLVMTETKDIKNRFIWFIVLIGISIIVTVIWRKSKEYFDDEKIRIVIFIVLINFLVSVSCMWKSINMILKENKNNIPNIEVSDNSKENNDGNK